MLYLSIWKDYYESVKQVEFWGYPYLLYEGGRRRGKIKPYRVGKERRYSYEELQSFLGKKKEDAVAEYMQGWIYPHLDRLFLCLGTE